TGLAVVAKSNGALNSTVNPTISGLAGSVQGVAVSGTSIYFGGAFTTVNDNHGSGSVTRNQIAMIDIGTGALSSFAPSATTGSGYVSCMVSDGTSLYVGGGFQKITDSAASFSGNGIAKITQSTGLLDGTFASNINVNYGPSALLLNGSNLYLVGNIYQVG